MSASSLTPFKSTVWLTMAMPLSMRRAQAARAKLRHLARMVGVERDVDRLGTMSERVGKLRRDALRRHDGHARVPAQDLDVGNCPSAAVTSATRRGDRMSGSPPVRITSQISRVRADVGERRGELGVGQGRGLARPHHLAAEAEAAVDRAHGDELQEHAVGVAVHDARHRALEPVADGVGAFGRVPVELARIGNELARDWVVGVGRIDQGGHRRRDRHRVARLDGGDLGGPRARDEARIGEVGGRLQGLPERGHCRLPSLVGRMRGVMFSVGQP